MILSLVIQAHPARREHALALQRRLGRPRVPISWDRSDLPRDTWRGNRAAWQHPAHDGWTHRLLLQDDVLPCAGFRAALPRALDAAPLDGICSFFVSEQLDNLARAQRAACVDGRPWAFADVQGFVPMQALCLPRWMVDAMLSWTEANPHPGVGQHGGPLLPYRALSRNLVPLDPLEHRSPNDDEIVARWARTMGHLVCVSAPSLVEHDIWTGSLIGNDHNHGRRAACLIGDGVDARDLPW